MKRITFAISLLLAAILQSNLTYAQALKQGNAVFEATYGFPNLYKSVLKSAYVNSGTSEDVDIGGIGPVGLNAEYMVSDNIGIGLMFNYTNTFVSYKGEGTNQSGQPVTYTYEVNAPRIRVIPRFSFHYGSTDNFDFYSYIGLGYNKIRTKFETNDPNFEFQDLENLIPIAFRLATGARYFFTDNVGATLELGVFGGGVVTGGMAFKL